MNLYAVSQAIMAVKNSIKPIVGLVRGMSVGIGFTMGSLFTFLYCTPEAVFSAPFTKAIILPEGSSTFMFPKIFGQRKANEILLLSEPVTAQEAKKFGYVNEILPGFEEEGDWPDMAKVPTIGQLLKTDGRTM